MSEQKLDNVSFFTSMFSPPCRFVHMVLKQLNIDCNIKEIDFPGGEHKSAEFLAINPAGKIPTLRDGDICLGESRAIACYLCNKYAPDNNLYPKSAEARAKVDQVLYADLAFVNAMYGYAQPFQVFFLDQIPQYTSEADVKKQFGLFEQFLGDKDYLAADHLTLADLSAINAVAILDLCKYDKFDDFPRLKAWIDRMRKLPYYKECTDNPSKQATAFYDKKIQALKEAKQ